VKLLNGSELALFIKERQAREVTRLRRASNTVPKLAIIKCVDDPVISTYVRLKKKYGADLTVDVEVYDIEQKQTASLIDKLNQDISVHGIIVQLPLEEPKETDFIVNLVAPSKDVDALGRNSKFEPATPMAIMWLLAGYNIDIYPKKVLLIGRGKLVGAPLEKILKNSGVDVAVADRNTTDLEKLTLEADIIITATGSPAILYPSMVKTGVVIVDAGVASEDGKTVGDVAPEMYDRDDITITPSKGGVGPLTVSALFENVILAAQRVSEAKHQPLT
jgi:methylenetetrahydrofolate dehydrogenase (NADP+)/methenyltetrahydrofolate cyclohydrolase